MTQQYLKPAPGITIPMADGRPWPAEGALVEVGRYERRRVADGDLVPATAEATQPAAAPASDEAVATSGKGAK